MLLAWTQIVNGACEEFLAGSGLALDQNARLRERYLLHLTQQLPYWRALSDYLLKVVFGLDLFLQVDIFRLQPVAQAPDLLVGEAIVQRNRHGHRYLFKQSPGQVSIGSLRCRHAEKNAAAAFSGEQRYRAKRLHALPIHHLEGGRKTLPQLVSGGCNDPLAVLKHPVASRSLGRHYMGFGWLRQPLVRR